VSVEPLPLALELNAALDELTDEVLHEGAEPGPLLEDLKPDLPGLTETLGTDSGP
jgi:hypothetical protein